MSLVTLSAPELIGAPPQYATSGMTANAVGEYASIVGRLWIESGAASKLLSSSGGKIFVGMNAVTSFVSGCTIRVGLQDPDANGFGDGTFDVYTDWVGGTDTLVAGWNTATIGTGSRTYTQGEHIVIQCEVTVRSNSDSVSIQRVVSAQVNGLFPYGIQMTGTPTKSTNMLMCFIVFDDGTRGWIEGLQPLSVTALAQSTTAFNSGSTPNEYAAVASLKYKVRLVAFSLGLSGVAVADDFSLISYADPLGTPSVIETDAFVGDLVNNSAGTMLVTGRFATPYILEPNTPIGFAILGGTANDINWGYYNLGSGYTDLKAMQPFTSILAAARTNPTGPFVEIQTYHLPALTLYVDQRDDGQTVTIPTQFTSIVSAPAVVGY